MMRQPDRQQQQLQKKKEKKQQQQAQLHDRYGGLGKRMSNPPKLLLSSPILGPTGDDSSHSIRIQGRSRSSPSSSGRDRRSRSDGDAGAETADRLTAVKDPLDILYRQARVEIPCVLPSDASEGDTLVIPAGHFPLQVPVVCYLPSYVKPGMTVLVRFQLLTGAQLPSHVAGQIMPFLSRDPEPKPEPEPEPEPEPVVAPQQKSGRGKGLGTTVRAQSNEGCGKKMKLSKNPKSNASGRVVGEDGRITEPGPYDYVGRETGAGSKNFHGNTFFKNLANSLISDYKAQAHGSRSYLPHALTQEIMFRRGGAFLTKVADRHYEVHKNQYDKMMNSALSALQRTN